MLVVNRFTVSQFAQKIQRKLAQTREAIGILVEVAEHVIVLGAEIIVASIFAQNQRIEKQPIAVSGQFAEQRAARARERFFFDFAKQSENLLPSAPQDDFLAHLEGRDEFLRLHHLYLPHALERLQLHAALFENPRKLRLHFGANELKHGEAAEQIDRRIALCLGAIQNREMNRDQQRLEIGRAGLARFGGAPGSGNKFVLAGSGNVHFEERFHLAKTANVARQMKT